VFTTYSRHVAPCLTPRVLPILAFVVSAALLALTCSMPARAQRAKPADHVITDARIYTVDAARSTAESLAVRDGEIVFVGSNIDVQRLIGPRTIVEDLHGQLVLPGLFDSHLHPIAMIKVDSCNLGNKPKSLHDLGEIVRDCLVRFPASKGGWLSVQQWNFADGNQPEPELPSLRAALDRASASVPIQLIGSDGHHGAYNSAGLALAKNASGAVVGYSKKTLAGELSAYRSLVGVDSEGNPSGAVNENAKAIMGAPSILMANFEQSVKERAQLPRLLNSAGITGILDAKASPPIMRLYDLLDREHKLTFRTSIAQFYDPSQITRPDGTPDYAQMLSSALRIRAKYAANPLIRADIVKLFADGSLEGNPYAVPPTLPNALSEHPYLQPIFARNPEGQLTVTGYVDTAAPICVQVRRQPGDYVDVAAINQFTAAHGFHPGQCTITSGQLRHDPAIFKEFVERFHRAGFSLHIHVIADGSLSAAIDAIEAARRSDGIATQHDGLAHVQLAQPSDVERIGRDHLFVAFTYSWAYADPAYDMTVVPFIDHVIGNSFAALHSPAGYYEKNNYPFKAVKQAGGTLVAGSDAPVETADPRPFVNMAMAVTRRLPGREPENPDQAISIRDAIDAYTIDGARFLARDALAGSIEVGKSADFIVLDRDILSLADSGRAEEIANTRVQETWFAGHKSYDRANP
jgi:predicted amidohydrolase YtcJ